MNANDAIARLHATLPRRDTPETVAELIGQALPPEQARRLHGPLHARLAGSIRHFFGWSSVPTLFRAPDRPDRQLAKARELASLFLGGRLPEGGDPEEVERLLAEFNELIGKHAGANSFLNNRRNRKQRAAMGLTLSRRRYDKLFRLAARLEQRLAKLRSEEAKYRLLLIGKAALAPDLAASDFAGHVPSAAFVAYYVARMKLRSEFTISGQQKPFDDLAAALLSICEEEDRSTSWYAIAHVSPRADVLARLTEEQKGRLLGRWFDILSETAEMLENAYRRTDVDLATMIVQRGNDSSTWNLSAGAWNRARDHWIALVDALELDALFNQILPGKVMRLMAADVAAWHRREGGDVHPDNRVWAELPKPWEPFAWRSPATGTSCSNLRLTRPRSGQERLDYASAARRGPGVPSDARACPRRQRRQSVHGHLPEAGRRIQWAPAQAGPAARLFQEG
jgi:hypothetical protein